MITYLLVAIAVLLLVLVVVASYAFLVAQSVKMQDYEIEALETRLQMLRMELNEAQRLHRP